MPQLRKDPIMERWVIVATERGKRRPSLGAAEKMDGSFCPFCYGNESKTPPEIVAYRPAYTRRDTPGWWTRVIPNKFPALQIEGDLNRTGEGIYDMMNGIGAHEVIVETPDHQANLHELETGYVEESLWAYRDRIVDLKKDTRIKYALIFKNSGKAAGASLQHPHSQLIATPIVPMRVQEELNGSKRYYSFKERCIFCDIVHEETRSRERVVIESGEFMVIQPYAPRFPFETWILPKVHDACYEDITKYRVGDLAKVLKETLGRLASALNQPPYNFVLHTAPWGSGASEYYHWHLEIMPVVGYVAGFEWGTGFYINPTPPEVAAAYLRQVELPVAPAAAAATA